MSSPESICLTCAAPVIAGDYCARCRQAVAALVERAREVVEFGRTLGIGARCACHRPRRRVVCAEQLAFEWRREARA